MSEVVSGSALVRGSWSGILSDIYFFLVSFVWLVDGWQNGLINRHIEHFSRIPATFFGGLVSSASKVRETIQRGGSAVQLPVALRDIQGEEVPMAALFSQAYFVFGNLV